MINAKKGKKKKNRMGKTKDLFKKIIDTKGNISCNHGHSKGQKWYGITETKKY